MQDRSTYLGGTDANRIAHGKLREVWLEKTGRAERPDLSDVLRVQLGMWTEPFNRRWFCERTQIVVDPVDPDVLYRHPTLPFLACHPDGFCKMEGHRAVWDAKHTGSGSIEEKVAYYLGQLTHNMLATGRTRAVLSVLFGNSGWAYGIVAIDNEFAGELMAREADLWDAILNDVEPDDLPPIGGQEKIRLEVKEVDMTGKNSWAAAAADFLANAEPAKTFERAKKDLKELVLPDVTRAYGHGVEVVRNRAGALITRPIKEKKEKAA